MDEGARVNVVSIVRTLKVVCLLCFLLPWVTVSCSGHPIGSPSGVDLALGYIKLHNPVNGQLQTQSVKMDWLVLAAAVVVIGGLVVSIGETVRFALQRMLVSSMAAAVLAFAGLQAALYTSKHVASGTDNNALANAAAGLFTVSVSYGFYLTMMALAGSSALCLVGRQGDDRVEAGLRFALTQIDPGKIISGGNNDVRFWDGMASKNDPDLLEEYLARFPNGTFAELARKRLQGQGIDIPPVERPLADNRSSAQSAQADDDNNTTFQSSLASSRGRTRPKNGRIVLGAIMVLAIFGGMLGVTVLNKPAVNAGRQASEAWDPGSRSDDAARAAADASASADASAADAAKATADAAATVATPTSPVPDADAAANDASKAAAAAQAAAMDAQRAVANAALPASPPLGNETRYQCTYAVDLSQNPIAAAADMTFTLDEGRSCVNGRSIYKRLSSGVLVKVMLNDQDKRVSILTVASNRQQFNRTDLKLLPDAYLAKRQAMTGVSKVMCPAPGDAAGNFLTQEKLASSVSDLRFPDHSIVERHIMKWRCIPTS